MSAALQPSRPPPAETVRDVQQTSCCVVGGGPGGMLLALLLARRGVPVTLLEAHQDFDRIFRGDTLHPALLEILDEIGLAEKLHRLPHVKWYGPVIQAADGPFVPVDFRRLKTRFPYIFLIPQEKFLDFLAAEAQQYPAFRLVMGANVQRLVEEDGVVRGVCYRSDDGWHEVRATLTVGADGRFSKVRHLAGFKPVKTSPPIHVLWFRLPRLPDDPQTFAPGSAPASGRLLATLMGDGPVGWLTGLAFVAPGGPLLFLDRTDHWQAGHLFLRKEHYQELRTAGLDAFRRMIVGLEPRFARHVEHLSDWHQLSLLSVEFSHCRRWYRPGLLLIGDAAHVMTPAAGSGIKYAMEDAVVAANLLARPLKAGRVRLRDLAAVQRRREWPTWLIQTAGAFAQQNFAGALARGRLPIRIPWLVRLLFRIPLVRNLPTRLFGFGWRVHVEN